MPTAPQAAAMVVRGRPAFHADLATPAIIDRVPVSLSVTRLLEVIQTQNDIASGGLGVDAVMDLIVRRAAALTRAAGGVIELVEGQQMVYRAVSGSAAHALGLRLPRNSSLSGTCVARREPLLCEDADLDPRVDREACRSVGVRSMVCVPLFVRAEAVGVLKVLSPEPSSFSSDDKELLRLLADVVAAAMKHAAALDAASYESRHDGLTALGNRRAYDEQLQSAVGQHLGTAQPLCLALLDLDSFKLANDRWGHSAGDAILRGVAKTLRTKMRNEDECFRIGGDEFAIVLLRTQIQEALQLVTATAEAVRDEEFGEGTIGISAGVVQWNGEAPAELHRRADEKLYEAKRARRPARSSATTAFLLSFPSVRPPSP